MEEECVHERKDESAELNERRGNGSLTSPDKQKISFFLFYFFNTRVHCLFKNVDRF